VRISQLAADAILAGTSASGHLAAAHDGGHTVVEAGP